MEDLMTRDKTSVFCDHCHMFAYNTQPHGTKKRKEEKKEKTFTILIKNEA